MSLVPGTCLGPYEITGVLGAGGMGEVYRARDTRLNRDVAIKVLPESFAADADRRARFEREAQAVAALSHPNILSIFDTGIHQGQLFVVTELLDGETLRERLQAGPMPVKKAIDIAVQIARGLAAAHDKHLVHRDLKPENVILLKDGQVKILDFGLARQVATGSGATETLAAMTDPGMVMGTVGYMAPEQVRGQAIDARADLFALGLVLYEMLTGQRAFRRDTPAETMTAILREDPPDLTATRADLSPALDRIVHHAIEKNPAERFQTARDVAFALEALSGSGSGVVATPARGTTSPKRSSMRWVWLGVAGALLAAIAFAAGRSWVSPASGLPTDWEAELLGGPPVGFGPRVSPNGQELAFGALVNEQMQVGLLRLASGEWRPLGTDPARGNAQVVAWSRDSAKLYFDRYVSGQPSIFSTSPLGGGDEKLVLRDASEPQVLADGSLLVCRTNAKGQYQLYRFWLEGEVLKPLGALGAHFRVFPNANKAVFLGRPEADPSAAEHLYVIDLDSGATVRLAPGVTFPQNKELWLFPLAVSPLGDWVLFDSAEGDIHRIVAVPSDGSPGLHPLLTTLTMRPLGLDVGPDWTLYLDQTRFPSEARWYTKAGAPAVIERLPDSHVNVAHALALDGNRALVPVRSGGITRVMVSEPGQALQPFVDTPEETASPFARLGPDHVVLIMGSGADRRVATVSVATGRVIKRKIDGINPASVTNLAGSPDGNSIFFGAENFVWSVPAEGGAPRKVRRGDWVAVDPGGRFLIVQVVETAGVRLFRVPLPLGNGDEQVIHVYGDDPHVTSGLAPNAVGRDGRLLVRIASKTNWFYPAAALDPAGRLTPLSPTFDRDELAPGWSDDGRVVTIATGFESTLWRFRPKKK